MGTTYFYANVSNSLKTKAANSTAIFSVATIHIHIYRDSIHTWKTETENVKDQR